MPSAPGGSLERRKREWLAQVRYLAGRSAEAAALQAEVAAGEPHVDRRCAALVNAGLAYRDDFAYERAAACFEAALALAVEHRLATHEGYAWLGVRTMAYRMDRAGEPDVDLVDAVRPLGLPSLTAQLGFNEAVVAWRLGRRDLGRQLALAALADFEAARASLGRAYATALAAACGAEVDVEWLFGKELAEYPRAALEVGALLHADPRAAALVRSALDRIREIPQGERNYVCTPAEALAWTARG